MVRARRSRAAHAGASEASAAAIGHVGSDVAAHVGGQRLNRSWTEKCTFEVHGPKQNWSTSLRTLSAFYSISFIHGKAQFTIKYSLFHNVGHFSFVVSRTSLIFTKFIGKYNISRSTIPNKCMIRAYFRTDLRKLV